MAITAIYVHLNCTDLTLSTEWFAIIFGRQPDVKPMLGLAEWHLYPQAGFQLFESRTHAGHGTLTLIVDSVRDEYARLKIAGLSPGDIELADDTTILRLEDLDGNLVVLAQPGKT